MWIEPATPYVHIFPYRRIAGGKVLIACAIFGSELSGAVELILLFWVMHFCVQINLGDLQRLVAEPTLDLHQVEARAQPVRCRRLAKPVKVMLLAYRAGLARYLDFMAVIVSAFANRRSYTARNSARRVLQSL